MRRTSLLCFSPRFRYLMMPSESQSGCLCQRCTLQTTTLRIQKTALGSSQKRKLRTSEHSIMLCVLRQMPCLVGGIIISNFMKKKYIFPSNYDYAG